VGGGEERGQGWWEDKGDVDACMRVVTSEGGWPHGHEVFFYDGRARGILYRVAASMLTARARAWSRPSLSVETMGLAWRSLVMSSMGSCRHATAASSSMLRGGDGSHKSQHALKIMQTKKHPIKFE
jgi:hypothetical protein